MQFYAYWPANLPVAPDPVRVYLQIKVVGHVYRWNINYMREIVYSFPVTDRALRSKVTILERASIIGTALAPGSSQLGRRPTHSAAYGDMQVPHFVASI